MPCINQRRLWYVIPITPRSRSIFADTDVEVVADPSIPCTDQEVEVDAVEVDEIVPSPSTNNSKDKGTDKGNDDSNMEDASDKESINLFVDLATMDLDMDSSACRDLLADEN